MVKRYQLIVSDFDGTLRRSQGGISEENRRAISEYTEQGGIFAICTGRMISSILPYARELGLRGPIVAYQGAVVQDTESGNLLLDGRIPRGKAAEICDFLENENLHVHVYDGDRFFVNKKDEFLQWYERACAVCGEYVQSCADLLREKDISPHKIIVMCSAFDRNSVYDQLSVRFGNEFYVTSSHDNLVEIVPFGINKGEALKFLAKYYRLPIENTIAIGDNYNDLPMIRAAGLGVAVANAEQALRDTADFITSSCDENGVGYVIRKFGLGEEL